VKSGTTATGYVNGVQTGTATVGATIGATTNSLYIGRSSTAINYANGSFDDVRYYSRSLNQQEITRLYTLGQPSKTSATVADKGALATGLLSHWTFDGKDMVGGVARDGVRGNNGTLTNIASSTFYTDGKIGQALNFDGVNDYIEKLGPSGFPTGNNPFSYSAWIKPRNAPSQQVILFYGTNTTNQSAYIEIGNADCGANRLSSGKWGATINCDSTTVTLGQWHLVTLTFDGTTARLYRNGVLADSDAASYNLVNTYVDIGRVSNSAFFSGSVDDVRVYGRALSATEVLQLYNLGR
jgi:hypothetical protein